MIYDTKDPKVGFVRTHEEPVTVRERKPKLLDSFIKSFFRFLKSQESEIFLISTVLRNPCTKKLKEGVRDLIEK